MKRQQVIAVVCAALVIAVAAGCTASHRVLSPTSAGAPTAGASGTATGTASGTASPRLPRSVSATPSPSPLPRPNSDRPGPVLVIPGFGDDEAMLADLVRRLRNSGRETTVVDLPGNATGDLRTQAQTVLRYIEQATTRGADSVDLVGYSAGGLVAALAVLQDGGHVRRVVSIGTPFHGTAVASFADAYAPSACPPACREMAPGSPLLEFLAAQNPALRGVPWLSIYSETDGVVQPPTSSVLDGAVNVAVQSRCRSDTVSHTLLPRDPVVLALVTGALGGDALSALPTVTCPAAG